MKYIAQTKEWSSSHKVC